MIQQVEERIEGLNPSSNSRHHVKREDQAGSWEESIDDLSLDAQGWSRPHATAHALSSRGAIRITWTARHILPVVHRGSEAMETMQVVVLPQLKVSVAYFSH